MQRIEAALARVEAAARKPQEQAAQLDRLARENARLRQAVAESLRRIDALIARHGGEV